MIGNRLPVTVITFLVLSAFALLLHSSVQGSLAIASFLTPTPVVFPAPRFGEPELICPFFRDIQPGYSWRGITIGSSTRHALESLLEQIGDYELVFPLEGTLANAIGYRWQGTRDQGISQQAPRQIDVCFQDGIIVVLDMSWMYQSPLYVSDFVALLGEADIVTWSLTDSSRIAFWFEDGIAADIFVQHGDEASFGRIARVIYFPPQSSQGYESRWPFTVTRTQPFYPVDPSIPSEQNPFDFDAMIATITSEPIGTPTLDFTSMATEAPQN